MNRKSLFLLVMVFSLVLAACGGTAAVTPEATLVEVTPLATATDSPPTAEPPTEVPPTEAPTEEPPPTEEPTAAPPSAADVAERIDTFISDQAAANRFTGAVLVARDGEVIFTKGYGLADQEEQIPNTPQTRFRIASLTKAFTAMAIMQLQEAGMVNVADSICDHMPDCPDHWSDVTIHHLLTHSSGLPDAQISRNTPTVQEDLLASLSAKPMQATPGSTFYYNNTNYFILGSIIEAVTGQSYEEVLQAQIFYPLGMADSGYSHDTEGLAVGYANRFREASFIDMSGPFAAGALYSTVEDLHRWTQAMQSEQLVSRETLDLIFTPHVLIEPGGEWSYGYGWEIRRMHERPVVGHYGWIDGFRSEINIFPENSLTTIVWTNREDNVPEIFGEILSKWALGIE
ncbi:MAG: serine hydrolase domain-containing protein [Chloroflexota bacterium]|jgi:CubicO group peptidase (beta-lactamase class C family)